jgi:sucrose-6-phosphate hydrolase SacC (GH32 family)
MKTLCNLLSSALVVVTATAGLSVTASPFDDAALVWRMSDIQAQGSAAQGSALRAHGAATLGVALKGEDREASVRRGGDGRAVQLDGGWLTAEQGTIPSFKLSDKGFTVAIRVRGATGKWQGVIFGKCDSTTGEVFSISAESRDGRNILLAHLRSDEIAGAHEALTELAPLGPTAWHDVVLRHDGAMLQLFVDGALRDDEVAVSAFRKENRPAYFFGTDPKETKSGGFRGLLDHVAVWNRAVSDDQLASISGVEKLADKRPTYYSEKYRPQFHFTAQKHWLNDPNGLVYYAGTYHMCYQHMPPLRPGAYKDWGHAVSADLVHWKQLTSAITPHRVWGGCWSGSAVVDWENTTGFRVGKERPIVAILTNGGEPDKGAPCTQCIASSVDGGKTFSYYPRNPVLKNVVGCNRDPKVIWHAPTKKWIMALYLDGNDYGLFASPDLKQWRQLCKLTLPGVSECPDLFPVAVAGDRANVKWVFWGANGVHLIGSFDGQTFKRESEPLPADYGANFYAAQTWSDIPQADGRRIQIAWMAGGKYPGMPFDQQMNFPTEVTLRTTPEGIRMYRLPVREIQKIWLPGKAWGNVDIKPGESPSLGMSGELFDIAAEFEVRQALAFGIRVCGQSVRYNVADKTLTVLGRSAPLLPEGGRIKLRILVDRTSMEVFGNDGRVVLTSCFLPADQNKKAAIFVDGGPAKLIAAEIHPLQSIWIDRQEKKAE